MNKKFLSVVLFGALMVGSSVTFTGCIDNDEPAGIENLRGAKAELLKAKAAVETAKADYVTMQARLVEANVKAKEIENQMQELELQKKQAKTEAEIAEINALLEVQKLQWEKLLVEAKQELAWTQKSYEDALKAIELAETVVSESEQKILHSAKVYLVAAAEDMNNKHDAMITAQKNLSNAYLNYDEEAVKAEINGNIALAEINKSAQERTVKNLEERLAKDYGTADWEKEVKELTDSIDVLNKEKQGKALEKDRIVNSDEYKTAEKNLNKAWDNLQLATIPADFSYEVPAAIVGKIDAAGGYFITEGDKTFFKLSKDSEKAQGTLTDIIAPLIKEIDEDMKAFTAEWEANQENAVKKAEDELKDAKEKHTEAVKKWKEKLAKYEELGNYAVATDQKIVNKVIDANFTKASAVLVGGASEIEKAAQTAARNAIATALHKYYTDVNAKVGLETEKFKINMGVVGDVEKTLVDWLSDTTLNGTYLNEILDKTGGWGTIESFKSALVLGENTAFITEIGKNTTKEGLKQASLDAFGPAYLYLEGAEYLTVQPSEADITSAYEKAVIDAEKANTAFKVIDAEQALADAKLMPEMKPAYEAFKKALVEEQTVIEKHIAGLTEAHKEAEAAFNKQKESIETIDAEIVALGESMAAITKVKAALEELLKESLGGSTTEAEYKEAISKELEVAKAAVTASEKTINSYKKQLAQIEEGTYTDQMYIEYKKVLLDEATKAYEAAKVVYEDAQARLQAVIEKLTKASAE